MKLNLNNINNIINTKILLITISLVIFFKYITDRELEKNIVLKI